MPAGPVEVVVEIVRLQSTELRRLRELRLRSLEDAPEAFSSTYAETAAWAKVLVAKQSQRILGAHLVGHGAEETIHTFALAIEKGMPASEIAERVYAYPTFHSDLKYLV